MVGKLISISTRAALGQDALGRLAKLSSGVSSLRRFRAGLSRELRAAGPRTAVFVARQLCAHGGGAGQLVGSELVNTAEVRGAMTTADVKAMGAKIDSWFSVDIYALYVLGPAWRDGVVTDDYVHSLSRSPNRWRRRAAVVSTVALNSKARGGRGDTTRTSLLCRTMVDDRDDMVVKGLSWALRELAKRDPAAAESFLSIYASRLASRVTREVRNKLSTGLKNPRARPAAGR